MMAGGTSWILHPQRAQLALQDRMASGTVFLRSRQWSWGWVGPVWGWQCHSVTCGLQ